MKNVFFFLQEEQHYVQKPKYAAGTLEELQQRDKQKLELAKEKGITVIVVPFWWDGTLGRYAILFSSLVSQRYEMQLKIFLFNLYTYSLAATMKEVVPQHLIPQSIETTQPIPKDIPADLLAQHQMYIEDIG